MNTKPKLYQCPECGLHYADQATAKLCEAWCSKHKSCNLDIAKNSEEVKSNKASKQEYNDA